MPQVRDIDNEIITLGWRSRIGFTLISLVYTFRGRVVISSNVGYSANLLVIVRSKDIVQWA